MGRAERASAENMLSQALKSLFAVAENYPQLRASENFQKLQDELSSLIRFDIMNSNGQRSTKSS